MVLWRGIAISGACVYKLTRGGTFISIKISAAVVSQKKLLLPSILKLVDLPNPMAGTEMVRQNLFHLRKLLGALLSGIGAPGGKAAAGFGINGGCNFAAHNDPLAVYMNGGNGNCGK